MSSTVLGVNSRQLQEIELIKKAKGCKVEELAEKLQCSIRTVKYDIAYLKRVYPDNIIIKRGRYGGGIYYENSR